ncbi:MAG: excinuclease ABC subunit UvrA [Planctomycetota bacterium]
MAAGRIELRGVRVHNLKNVDIDIPHRRLTVVCGVSGSGKTSLALDTLYAEGQRRYMESFSTYTRQFLDPLEKPAADRIDGLPPAIAVTRADTTRSQRATVASATEIADYLRLVFGRIGRVQCPDCAVEVRAYSPERIAERLAAEPPKRRAMIGYPLSLRPDSSTQDGPDSIEADQTGPAPTGSQSTGSQSTGGPSFAEIRQKLVEDGFVRAVIGDRVVDLTKGGELAELLGQTGGASVSQATNASNASSAANASTASHELVVIVDRLMSGPRDTAATKRLVDSLETCQIRGAGCCVVFLEAGSASPLSEPTPKGPSHSGSAHSEAKLPGPRNVGIPREIDGREWREVRFFNRLVCGGCGRAFRQPEPRLFNYNSPLGACPRCEGFGNLLEIDFDRVIPDPGLSLSEGAITCWLSPAYEHHQENMLIFAQRNGIPIDKPYRELTEDQQRMVFDGVLAQGYPGVRGFFKNLGTQTYKMHHRMFLNRWRISRECPECSGRRLRPEALAVRIADRAIDQWTALRVDQMRGLIQSLTLEPWEAAIARQSLAQIRSRLEYLETVGLGHLGLDRPLRTLSGGEAQRVALTTTLGASLVNMLYVLDEPSVGLHPRDVEPLVAAIQKLRDRGNTVVVVEHEEALLRAADQLLEIGPGAGENGGELVFAGSWTQMLAEPRSATGSYLANRAGRTASPRPRRGAEQGWLRLVNARGRNLRNVTVEFPLGTLCVVTGVSGSGKSTLVQDTLHGALCQRKDLTIDEPPQPYEALLGDGAIDDVVMIDQSPIGRSPRSNPAIYLKAFDPIRAAFAETAEARAQRFGPGHFSFNVEGGRCETCQGDGFLEIDMQFLPDVYMKCGQCGGKRYRKEVLAIAYRGKNIAEVLEMTVREAFGFFRGQPKVQIRLKPLLDVGLDYLRIGQPANTLSAGESQRLKLAAHLASTGRKRTLFLFDEPTTGLHFTDVERLRTCFEALLDVGHSMIVVEHNLQIIAAADHIIDLGPGAADAGGTIVAEGTPEQLARRRDSATGQALADWFSER